jgi:hypothetical protein
MATSGIWWSYVTAMRGLLSRRSAFQNWVGATTAAAALDYLHLFRAAPDLTQLRFAVVGRSEALQFLRRATGHGLAAFAAQQNGSCMVAFYRYLGVGSDYGATSAERFFNDVGSIVEEVMASSWSGQVRVNRIQEQFELPEDFPMPDSEGRRGYVSAWVFADGGE